MTKKEVQQRVLLDGKPLALNKFTWDEKTKTFSSEVDGLVGDFSDIDGINIVCRSYCTFSGQDCCTFSCRDYCNFSGRNYCTFLGWNYCTFSGMDCCTVTVWSYCTFSGRYNNVIVRRHQHQVIQPQKDDIIITCPYNIKGYLCNGVYSETGKQSIIADGILSEIVSERKQGGITVYKVINHGETKQSYLIKSGELYSHGETIKQAKESLIYKIGDRDTTKYEGWTLDTGITLGEAIQSYRAITGACETQTRAFVESEKRKDKYTVQEIIDITQGQYNSEVYQKFFAEKN